MSHLLGDEVLQKISKLHVHSGFATVSKLNISVKRGIVTSGKDNKKCRISPPGCYTWLSSLKSNTHVNYNNYIFVIAGIF
jgi:hypothetical protein